jgi:hypothetical protein
VKVKKKSMVFRMLWVSMRGGVYELLSYINGIVILCTQDACVKMVTTTLAALKFSIQLTI